MSRVVIDASAGVEIVLNTKRGQALARLIPHGTELWVPEHFTVEVGCWNPPTLLCRALRSACTTGFLCGAPVFGSVAINAQGRWDGGKSASENLTSYRDFWIPTLIDVGLARVTMRTHRGQYDGLITGRANQEGEPLLRSATSIGFGASVPWQIIARNSVWNAGVTGLAFDASWVASQLLGC